MVMIILLILNKVTLISNYHCVKYQVYLKKSGLLLFHTIVQESLKSLANTLWT